MKIETLEDYREGKPLCFYMYDLPFEQLNFYVCTNIIELQLSYRSESRSDNET